MPKDHYRSATQRRIGQRELARQQRENSVDEAEKWIAENEPKYLVPKRKKGKAHVWTGEDTQCRMASTGGLSMSRYDLAVELPEGVEVCSLCSGNITPAEKKPTITTRKEPSKEFPKHELELQADGSYRSKPYSFDISRWKQEE